MSETGRGRGDRRWTALYASADVEFVDLCLGFWPGENCKDFTVGCCCAPVARALARDSRLRSGRLVAIVAVGIESG